MSPTCDKFYLQSLDESERKWKSLGCVILFATHGLYSPGNSPGQNTGVGSLSLLQGIFPTQGYNTGLPHCRQILYQLSHQGSPRILEWVGSPSLLQGIFLTRESNRGLLHCRRILYQLSYKMSPKGKHFWKRIDKCVCITESLCCTPETLLQYKIKSLNFFNFNKESINYWNE